jgi:hypothetical protein
MRIMSDQERVDFYQKQIELEDKIVKKATDSVKNVKNLESLNKGIDTRNSYGFKEAFQHAECPSCNAY